MVSGDSKRNSIVAILGSLGWPLILGISASIGFFALIEAGTITHPLVVKYCTGHPVSYVTTGMFFVGLAALALKLLEIAGQYAALNAVRLEQPGDAGHKPDESSRMLDSLAKSPARVQRSYLWRRLHDALRFVQRKRSAEGLDDELKYLADLDAERQQNSYSFVRMITWATPMLGFLGTVIGIAAALGELKPEVLDSNLQVAMAGLKDGLYVAFDTTALALCFTIALMFVQFMVERVESQLLAAVDARVNEHMVGRFEEVGSGHDPHVKSIERIGRAVVESTQQLVLRQSQLWQKSIEAAEQRWTKLSESAGGQLQGALAAALQLSLNHHAERMAQIDQESDEAQRRRWEQWQVALSENARLLHGQQKEMAKQGEIMLSVVQATGDVIKLEKSLNENLRALAGSKNFEDTVMSLSAAIHLLNSRLGHASGDSRKVELEKGNSQGRAA